MKIETQNKLNTLLTGINTKEKYEEDNGHYYLPDVFYSLSEKDYDITEILSKEQIDAIKLYKDNKYFSQEEAHEVIDFLVKKCYELGATKNY